MQDAFGSALALTPHGMHNCLSDERAKIITEQALALLRKEQEAIYRALAESLGRPDIMIDHAWYDEAEDRLTACDRGEIPSVIAVRKKLRKPDYWRSRIR